MRAIARVRAVAIVRATVLAAMICGGCSDRGSPPTSPPPPTKPWLLAPASRVTSAPTVRVDASDLVAKFECTRCHDVPAIAAAPRDKHCVRCHQEIHAGTFITDRGAVDARTLARWQGRITSLRWAPSLAGVDRLRRSWIRDFLLAPHDIRPGLVAQMPRLAITPAEAEQIAAYLVRDRMADHLTLDRSAGPAAIADPLVPDRSAGAESTVARGQALFRSLACARCHRFTGAAADDPALHVAGRDQVEPLGGSWALAPDLRHTRARLEPEQIAASIVDPRGAMPRLGIAADDARALAAFIATTPLTDPPPPTPVTRLPILARAVTWDEVETKVFRHVCWHCHAVPDYARGDGGPGNSGGFGFAPRGLDLSSYQGISAGSLDDAGESRSVFAALADGTPRIVAHLLARHTEEAGSTVAGIRGMPLGLPPIPLEDIQLVETWISQGRPR